MLTGCARNVDKTTNTVTVTNTVTITETEDQGTNEDVVNSLFTSLATDAPEDALLLIVNGVDNVNYEDANTIETVTIEGVTSNSESMLLVPKYQESIITIESVEYNIETEEIETKYEMFNSGATRNGYAIRFNAFRPEGAPINKITITYNGETIDYLVSYNGKDGNPTFEYVE
jgi:hypothetical protein